MTGWRIGYAIGPQISWVGCCAFTVHGDVLPLHLAGCRCDRHPRNAIPRGEMRKEYDRRRRLIVDGLNKIDCNL